MAITSNVHLEFETQNLRYRLVVTTDYLTEYGLDVTDASLGARLLGTIYFNPGTGAAVNQQHITAGDPLINLTTGVASAWYALPVDSNGEVVNGVWTGNVSLRIANTNLQFTSITLPDEIETDGNDWLDNFLIEGNTITLEAGTPQDVVVASAEPATVSSNVLIITSTVIASATHDGIGFDISNPSGNFSHTYQGCQLLDGSAEFSYNCTSGQYGSWLVTNSTAITTETLVSLSGKIFWPSLTERDPIDITALPYSSQQLALGSYSINFTQVISETQDDGLVLTYSTTYIKQFDPVVCAANLCGLMGCYGDLLAAYALDKNTYGPFVTLATGYITEYNEYLKCANNDAAAAALILLQGVITNSGCECNCCNETSGSIWVNNAPTVSGVNSQWSLFDGVPSINEDLAHGYVVGSIVLDTNTSISYICTLSTNGAAEWEVYFEQPVAAYKLYKALITQNATSNPSLGVIDDTLSAPIVWTRTSTGAYLGTLASEFTVGKTWVSITNNVTSDDVTIAINRVDANTILVTTRDDSGALADGILSFTPLLIEVYP